MTGAAPSGNSTSKAGSSLVAGGLAGVLAKTAVAPLERVKIMFQVTNEPFSLRKFPAVMLEVYHREGMRALWRGHMANILRVAPYSGIQFMVYDCIKGYFERRELLRAPEPERTDGYPDMRRIREHMIAGAAAGSVSTVCTYPLDLARSRLAVIPIAKDVCHGRSFALFNYIRSWYRIGGIRELYRGLLPTVAGVTPYGAIAFAANDTCKETMRKVTGEDPTTVHKMMSGAFAGVTAQSMTYPLEMVRRNMQTHGFVDKHRIDSAFVEDSSQAHGVRAAVDTRLAGGMNPRYVEQHMGSISNGSRHHPPSFYATAQGIYTSFGVRGFFKGLLLNWIKGPVTLSISFTTYDSIKTYLDSLSASWSEVAK